MRCAETGAGATRIDRWLFAVRLFKSRAAAAAAVSGGRVHLNGERVRPARAVKPGDMIGFTRGSVLFECAVTATPPRRGPASEAARAYEESPASKTRREEFAARRKITVGIAPHSDERPDKHGRKLLRRLRGRG